MSVAENEGQQTAEIARLRARVVELETQLIEVEAWADRVVADAQERLYWLDRWHLDLNRLMERPGVSQLSAAVRIARAAYRLAGRLRHRLRSGA
jgi:hypothetical protein